MDRFETETVKIVYKVLVIFLCLTSLPLFAEELDLNYWYQLSVMVQKQEATPSFLPTKLSPTQSKEGVLQQVFNYNLENIKAAHPEFKVLDTKWRTDANGDAAQNQTPTPEQRVVYEVRPFETKAKIEFDRKVTATLNYQIWNRQMELRVAPNAKYHGMGLALSHMNTSLDESTRFLVTLDW